MWQWTETTSAASHLNINSISGRISWCWQIHQCSQIQEIPSGSCTYHSVEVGGSISSRGTIADSRQCIRHLEAFDLRSWDRKSSSQIERWGLCRLAAVSSRLLVWRGEGLCSLLSLSPAEPVEIEPVEIEPVETKYLINPITPRQTLQTR